MASVKVGETPRHCPPFRAIGIVSLLTLVFTVPVFAQQTWQRTYGGSNSDVAVSVSQTFDGGYIVAGGTYSFGHGSQDFYLVKTDAFGDTQWTRTYGGDSDDAAQSVQQTSDSGYILVGWTKSFGAGDYDVYLIKTNSAGDTLWTRTYGGRNTDIGWSVQPTTDGGYIVAGQTKSFSGIEDVYLIKTDSVGDTLWTRTYGGLDWDMGFSVRQTWDKVGYIVSGETYSFGHPGSFDVYLIRTDENGDTIWTRTFGGWEDENGYSVQQTSDSGYIVAGTTGGGGIYLVKTDRWGDTIWVRTIDDTSAGRWAHSVQQTSDGGYVVAGYTYRPGPVAYQVYLVKLNSCGDTLWSRNYGGAGDEIGYSVGLTSDNGFVVAGWTVSFGAGGSDFYLIKTDSLGNTAPYGIAEHQAPSSLTLPSLSLFASPSLFTRSTLLTYALLDNPSPAGLEIRDITGRLVRSFAIPHSSLRTPHCLAWDGTDNDDQRLPSGCYFCTLRAGSQTAQAKVLLAR